MFKVTLPFHLTLICFYYHYSFVSSGGSYFSINVYSIQQCASLNESQRLQIQDSTLHGPESLPETHPHKMADQTPSTDSFLCKDNDKVAFYLVSNRFLLTRQERSGCSDHDTSLDRRTRIFDKFL